MNTVLGAIGGAFAGALAAGALVRLGEWFARESAPPVLYLFAMAGCAYVGGVFGMALGGFRE